MLSTSCNYQGIPRRGSSEGVIILITTLKGDHPHPVDMEEEFFKWIKECEGEEIPFILLPFL